MLPQAPWLALAKARLAAKTRLAAAREISFVAPSQWLAQQIRKSPVGAGREVQVIANGLDLDRYKPIDKTAARALFNLPPQRPVLLFGAVNSRSDSRKGYAQLDAALRHLAGTGALGDLVLCVFGSARRERSELHGVPVFNVGQLHDDESLAALYSAADLFVAPSLQDNLPNTVVEAAACGLPTVAFDIGGMRDIIDDGVTGLLAPTVDPVALAGAIARAMASSSWLRDAGIKARLLAQARFDDSDFAAAHLELYSRVLQSTPHPS
jgi:glycosyltransferase involved in cell wall biosynthesis